MTSPAPRCRAYLLRLWQTAEAAPGWRASLEDPHTGERLAFATLADLATFLAQPPVSGPPASPLEQRGRNAR